MRAMPIIPFRASKPIRYMMIALCLALIATFLAPGLVVASTTSSGPGLLRVSTDPPELSSLITVSGEPRNVGAVNALELPGGTHEVCFGSVAGYTAPQCEQVEVQEGKLTEATGSFSEAGTLHVEIEPATLQPTVTVAGIERDRTPVKIGLPVGSHEICVEDLAGYDPVPCETVSINGSNTTSQTFSYHEAANQDGDVAGTTDGRVSEGLVSLYDFAEGEGTTVVDTAGLYDGLDLNIADANAITWTDAGLRFDQPTIATTDGAPTALYDQILNSQQFTIEAWVTPANTTQNGPARIATLSSDTRNTNLLLGQGEYKGAGDQIEARLHERTGDWQLRTDRGTLTEQLTHLVITRTTDGTVTLYLDGQPATQTQMAATLDGWNPNYRLAIGAELTGERPWLGTYHLLAIYNTALTPQNITTNHTAGPNTSSAYVQPEPDVQPEPVVEPEPDVQPEPAPQDPEPPVYDSEGAITTSLESLVEQFGLKVQFDRDYPVGQFINGDYFVVGSPTVVATSPSWDGRRHGSMVNPVRGNRQGYHSDAPGYEQSLNFSAQLPRKLQPGDSLIHTHGWVPGESGTESLFYSSRWEALRPSLRDAMVLTVLEQAPPAGSFRPPYAGDSKPLYNAGDLQRELLPRLQAPATAPSWTSIEKSLERPWLDHFAHDTGRYVQPKNNMSNYGREIARDINQAIYMLMMNVPLEQKEKTLIGVVQFGIDSHANALQATGPEFGEPNGWSGGWGGALGVGRKWPVLFAGIMLNDKDGMLDIGTDLNPSFWQEDAQTYYVPRVDDGLDHLRPPGEPSWGERAYTRPNSHGIPGNLSYRTQGARAWNAAALGARIMGAEELWNWDAFFDYTDYHMSTETGAQRAMNNAFFESMWDTYRRDY